MTFFAELKRRNVIRVGIAYVVVAWLVSQVAEFAIETFGAPDWVLKILVVFLMLGLPIVAIFAWAFELTPEGIRRERDVDRNQSIVKHTGRKLDYTIIFVMALALGYFIYDKLNHQAHDAPQTVAQAEAQIAPPVVAGTPSVDPSIAVLPFADLSPEQDQGYFSDGISEELLNVLVKVRGLKVASRTSSFTYKGSNLSLAEIADELKVNHVLEGSVRKADNRVRITAQLIDATTDRHIWSETFDRDLVDIFAIQDEIANAIVAALSKKLGILEDTPAISVAKTTDNLDAYELYLKARGLFLTRQQLEESIALYERAVALDPAFARAWEGLAAVYAVVESWGFTGRDWDSLALSAAERALELEPGLSTPWAVKGQIATNNNDYVSGMAHLDRAVQLDPTNATNYLWRGINYSTLGMQAESIADYERCLEIDPAYANCKRHLALSYMIINHNEQALSLIEQVAKYGFKVFSYHQQYSQRLMSLGQRLAATIILVNHFDSNSAFPVSEVLDAMEFPERDHGRGLQKLLNWIDNSGHARATFAVPLVAFKAYHLIEPVPSMNRWVWLEENTDFRASEYFVPFMRKAGVAVYWRAKGFPPGCRPLGEEGFECD
ncbi:MAG: tetratricopeptide repeat protein [Xanthomonadales bacterium]|nr:tetratricopeptide repeat protein [Xanthomonadales bacterium]